MQKREGKILFSAGDLVAFLECEHAITLALQDLMHAFLRIAERSYRILRVVYNRSVHPVRVITVYFDRRLRGRV